jgi:hypothetical protein
MARRTKRNRRGKRSRRRGGGEPRVISFYNEHHYGDNILNLKFLYNISSSLANRKIHYYYQDKYNKQKELDRYVNKDIVQLLPLASKPADAIHLWMGNNIGNVISTDFERYYELLYKNILSSLSINAPIDTSLYQSEPYLEDIYKGLNPKFHDLDVLIINSHPQSGQLKTYDKVPIDAMCIRLQGKYKIATTTPVNDAIPCTMRDGLFLQDIGAISTHAKYIIAVFSGPITACFNSSTKKNVKRWFIMTSDPYIFTQIDCVLVPRMEQLANIESQFT